MTEAPFALRGNARSAVVFAIVIVAGSALASVETAAALSQSGSWGLPTPATDLAATPAQIPGGQVIYQGQASTVTATVPSSGTAPYSWQWLYSTNAGRSYQTATYAQCGTPRGVGAPAGARETCAFATTGGTAPGTYYFELQVADSATVPESVTSAASSTVTVEGTHNSAAAPKFDTDPQEDCTGTCDTANWFAGTGGSGALAITTAAANELLVLEITDSGQTGTGLSTADISDTQGSTWILEPVHAWNGFGHEQYVFYAIDATAGSDTVTIDTAAGSHTDATDATAVLSAFSGVDTSAPIAAEGTFATGTGTQSSASVTTSVAPTTILGVVSTTNGASAFTATSSPPFTQAGTINDGVGTASFVEYFADTASGAYTSQPTWTGSVRWGAVAIAIQGASPLSVTVSPTTETLDLGQSGAITATATGGTGALTYTWSVASGNCPGFANSGASTLTYSPTGTTNNCVLTVTVVDSVGDTVQPATGASVTVNTALTAPGAPTPNAIALDVNQAETVTGTIPSTGSPTYSWTWLVSVNGGAYAAETQCTTNGGTGAAAGATETCFIPANRLTAGDSYNFELKVTDSATTAETATSTASATVSVTSALTAPAAPTASATNLDVNQALTVTGTIPNTGTSTYSWQWLVSINGAVDVATTQCTTNSGSGAAAGAGETCAIVAGTLTVGDTYSFELQVADSATTPESATSTASSTVSVASALTAPSAPTTSATAIDLNQALIVTGTIPSTGTSTYAWQWLVSINDAADVVATQCPTNGGGGASPGATETCSISGSTLTAGDTYSFELQVTDSATSPETVASSASATVQVSSTLTAPGAPTPSGTALDADQTETVTGTIPSSGTAPYSWQWLVSINGAGFAVADQCTTNSGSGASGGAPETCSIASGTFTSGDTYSFELQVTDSATTPESATSTASSTVSVMSALSAPSTPQTSATTLDLNQALTISGTIPGTGTPTYSWQWLVSVNGASYVASTYCAVNNGSGALSGATATCAVAANALTAGSSYAFELEVTDSATSPETATSSASTTIQVSSTLTAPATPTPSGTALDADQSETVTGSIPSTGTAAYSWQWLVSINGAADLAATQCATNGGSGAAAGSTETCSIAGGTLTAGDTYSFELQVRDGSGAGPETQTSSSSTTVSVSPPLTAPAAPTISASTLSLAQPLTVSATLPTSGTPSYAWQWMISTDGGAYANASVCGSSVSGSGAAAGSTVRCTVPSGILAPGSSYTFELKITDSASLAESATSPASPAVEVVAPAIEVGTSQGPVGAVYSVAGSGFTASSTVTVSFGSVLLTPTACSDGTFSGTRITTDASGHFDCSFAVPSEASGTYPIVGTDTASSSPSLAFSFTVTTPAMTVTPGRGWVGGTVTVNGTGFSVAAPLASLIFDSQTITSCLSGSLTTNGVGAFSCTFTVPSGISGSTVRATDAGGAVATATYTAVAPPPPSNGAGGWLWLIVATVVLAVLLVILGVRRRQSRRSEESPLGPPEAPSSAAERGAATAAPELPVSPSAPSSAWASPTLDEAAEAMTAPIPEVAPSTAVVPELVVTPASDGLAAELLEEVHRQEAELTEAAREPVVDATEAIAVGVPARSESPPKPGSEVVPESPSILGAPPPEAPAGSESGPSGRLADAGVTATEATSPTAPETTAEGATALLPSGAESRALLPPITDEKPQEEAVASPSEAAPIAPGATTRSEDETPPPAEPAPERIVAPVPEEPSPAVLPASVPADSSTTFRNEAEPAKVPQAEDRAAGSDAADETAISENEKSLEAGSSESVPAAPEAEASHGTEPAGDIPSPTSIEPVPLSYSEAAAPAPEPPMAPVERPTEPGTASSSRVTDDLPAEPAPPPSSPSLPCPEPSEPEAGPDSPERNGPSATAAEPLREASSVPTSLSPKESSPPASEAPVTPAPGALAAARLSSIFVHRSAQAPPLKRDSQVSSTEPLAAPPSPGPAPEANRSGEPVVERASDAHTERSTGPASIETRAISLLPETKPALEPALTPDRPVQPILLPGTTLAEAPPEASPSRTEPEPAAVSSEVPPTVAETPSIFTAVSREEEPLPAIEPPAFEEPPRRGVEHEMRAMLTSLLGKLEHAGEPVPENPPKKPVEPKSGDGSTDPSDGNSP